MSRLLPPLCLVIALSMLIAGFAMLAVERPSEPMELHQARVTGDDAYRDVLEADLARRRRIRVTLITSLFLGAGLMVVLAFLAMRLPPFAGRAWLKSPMRIRRRPKAEMRPDSAMGMQSAALTTLI